MNEETIKKPVCKKLNCNEVSWINAVFYRFEQAIKQDHPSISRLSKVAKLSALMELMEILSQ